LGLSGWDYLQRGVVRLAVLRPFFLRGSGSFFWAQNEMKTRKEEEEEEEEEKEEEEEE
jgi:hypothetical protein